MRLKIMYIAALAAFALNGCATPPEPKRIETSKIAIQGKTMPSTAGSLWPGETTRNALFQDNRARNVGDIVTIEVVEKTSAIKEATTATARKSTDDASITKFLGLPTDIGTQNFLGLGNLKPEISASYDASFDGSGKTKRAGELTATIAARVVDVLPNGNLVIEGKKDTIVNNELQFMVLSGIVRPEDINDSNVVQSTRLSDARIEYSGRGVVDDVQSPGWMRRTLDHIWPF